jgi:hypothetical protein
MLKIELSTIELYVDLPPGKNVPREDIVGGKIDEHIEASEGIEGAGCFYAGQSHALFVSIGLAEGHELEYSAILSIVDSVVRAHLVQDSDMKDTRR